jgi:hypothetical protein
MNCSNCQTANDPGAAFCANCGTRFAPVPAGASGYTTQPGPGYGPPSGQAPGGQYSYPQGQYQPGQYQPGQPGQYQPGQPGPFGQRMSALPPVNFDLTRVSAVDKVVAGATLVTMISLWLPWFSGKYSALGVTSTGSVSGTGDHHWLWLEFLLALVLLAYLGARAAWERLPFRIPVAHETVLIAGTGLQFLLIVIGFFAMPSTSGLAGFSISWDFGAFLALIASVVAAAPVIYPPAKAYLDARRAA